MYEDTDDSSPLRAATALHAEGLLRECEPLHLGGLVDLLRFGVAGGDGVGGAYVAATWVLNAARHDALPKLPRYQRPDGSGFFQIDPDALRGLVRGDDSDRTVVGLKSSFCEALAVTHAAPQRLRFADAPQATAALLKCLEAGQPTVVELSDVPERLGLVLAVNQRRGQLFCCEVEESRARLRWLSIKSRALGALRVLSAWSMVRERNTAAALDDAAHRAPHVTHLDSEEGLLRLREAEGLGVVAYSALHGHSQRDLSSCNVASLASVALPRGARTQLSARAGGHSASQPVPHSEFQATLRALAVQQLKEQKGTTFEYRGLSVAELAELARSVGLDVHTCVLPREAATDVRALDQFRAAARISLGRTIVNFLRPALGQQGAGHHSVVVAYHAASDSMLIDDPAGFKMPPFWVKARKLVEAMATVDESAGPSRGRGYLIVRPEASQNDNELSNSVMLRR